MTGLSIRKYLSVLAVLAVLLAAPWAHGETKARYEAVFSDGTRLDGEKISGWGEHPGSPQLDGIALFDAKRTLRWLRDRTGKPWRPGEYCPGYIEFIGGDRIVGCIEGVGAAESTRAAAHLLIKPAASLHQPGLGSSPRLRILPGRIERVVFRGALRRRFQPGTLYYFDGRKVGFIQLRWKKESVVLLLKDGTREVKISDIAEVHFPRIDPWRAYYQELAVLSPSCRSRMVRIETIGGLIVTGSSLRFGALAYDSGDQQKAVNERLKQLGRQLASLENKRKANQLKFDRARAKYHEQLTESEKRTQASRQAYQKAQDDMRRRIDGLRKADLAELTKRREKLDKELRSADRAMVKRLGQKPPEKRDKMLRTFRAKQEQWRKSREKSLEDERLKRERQRKQELERFISTQTRQLQRHAKELQDKAAAAKQQFEKEAMRWNAFLAVLESARSRRASVRGGQSDTWLHVLQPVWSLDPLWVRFGSIRMRWSFAPERVPLCRLRPEATLNPPFLPERTNRSFDGGPLRSGADQYAWGFAVHAYSELHFPLSKCASAFRSRIGLDRVVGPGGCARARVYVGSVGGRCAYESPLLIGSKKTVDTGRIALKLPPGGPRRLVLQADPVDRGFPPGADPLNIRDKLDWLDPRIELNPAALQEQVRRQIGPLLAFSPGWMLRLDRRGVCTWTSLLDQADKSGLRRFWTMLEAGGRALSLRREMKIATADKWLAVHLGLPTGENPRPDTVTLHVGGRQVSPRKVPIRQSWQDRPAPLVFSLAQFQGEKVTLELTQAPGGKPVLWRAVRTLAAPPPAYRLVDIMKLVGKSDMKVPYGLGQALQSNRIAQAEKLAALEINELGGVVNFTPLPDAKVPLNALTNVLIGRDWAGGDKAFINTHPTFKKMPSLKSLLVTPESGVSTGAIAKLKAEMPKLTISRIIRRIPSTEGGAHRPVTWRNRCAKGVTILWIDPQSRLRFSVTRYLEPGQELKRSAFVGIRYEAHYPRKDYTNAQDYIFSQPLSSFVVTPGAVWEIKP